MHTPPDPRRFFSQPAESLAPALLGTILVRTLHDGSTLRARIVETEAYVGIHDRASHAYHAHRSPRNESMYAQPGVLYVYFAYGMHHCANIVCGSPGEPVAVLLRSLEPLDGIPIMRARRHDPRLARKAPIPDHHLCRGPGNLCRALNIDRSLDGIDLVTDNRLSVEIPSSLPISPEQVSKGPRIGIGDKGEWTSAPLRFWISNSPSVSRSREEAHRRRDV
ncbi:MAG: DNA-3-methyladenine glycosylase [Phycisphaeraceae bacterium]|nr:DNA-3-methyladenine glycosylase [Phycisphaeraceae bacterium]